MGITTFRVLRGIFKEERRTYGGGDVAFGKLSPTLKLPSAPRPHILNGDLETYAVNLRWGFDTGGRVPIRPLTVYSFHPMALWSSFGCEGFG